MKPVLDAFREVKAIRLVQQDGFVFHLDLDFPLHHHKAFIGLVGGQGVAAIGLGPQGMAFFRWPIRVT